MKKIIVSLLSLMLLLSLLVGCAQTPENEQAPEEKASPTYEIYETGANDYVSEANHSIEMSLPYKQYFIDYEKIGTTKTFLKPNGDTVVGTYTKSHSSYWYNGTMDMYEYIWEEGTFQLGWNPTTNRQEWYMEGLFDAQYDATLPQKTEEECITIAETLLVALTEDAEAYVLDDVRYFPSTTTEMQPSYYITFRRKIGSFRTTDLLAVSVTCYGEVEQYGYWGFDSMGDKSECAPNDETLTLIEEKMDAKLLDIYASYVDEYSLQYEWNRNRILLTKMQDGRLGLFYFVDVDVLDEEGNSVLPNGEEGVELFVYLEA